MKMIERCVRVAAIYVVAIGCSGGAAQPTGQSCAMASDCYKGLDAGALKGQVTCLTSLPGGYCSHTCQQDSDCCAVSGECAKGLTEVCAPLESNPQTYCFVSCEAADISTAPDGGSEDPNTFCGRVAGTGFTCRSTGGGAANKKFCAH
jgi:hypothetical protein